LLGQIARDQHAERMAHVRADGRRVRRALERPHRREADIVDLLDVIEPEVCVARDEERHVHAAPPLGRRSVLGRTRGPLP